MANLQDIMNLAKADGGKFFVIDETGEAKLVILSLEDYQKLLLGKLQRQVLDIENINQMITKAQLQETVNLEPEIERPVKPSPAHRTYQPARIERQDLRAEVIDPSFDYEAPKMDTDDF